MAEEAVLVLPILSVASTLQVSPPLSAMFAVTSAICSLILPLDFGFTLLPLAHTAMNGRGRTVV